MHGCMHVYIYIYTHTHIFIHISYHIISYHIISCHSCASRMCIFTRTHTSTYWYIDISTYGSIEWSIYWYVVLLIYRSIDLLIYWSINRSIYQSIDLSIDRSIYIFNTYRCGMPSTMVHLPLGCLSSWWGDYIQLVAGDTLTLLPCVQMGGPTGLC